MRAVFIWSARVFLEFKFTIGIALGGKISESSEMFIGLGFGAAIFFIAGIIPIIQKYLLKK